LASTRLPLGQRLLRKRVIDENPVHQHVVVAHQARQAVAGYVDAAAAGRVVVENVVLNRVVDAAAEEQQGIAAVGGLHDRVVHDDVVQRAGCPVLLKEGDAAGV